jgi:hypothetical protein
VFVLTPPSMFFSVAVRSMHSSVVSSACTVVVFVQRSASEICLWQHRR